MKQLLFIFSFILLAIFAGAQDSPSIRNWTIGLEKGYTWLDGEVEAGNGLALGLHVNKHLGSVFAIRLQVGMGTMQGIDNEASRNWVNHPVWNGTVNPAINYNQAANSNIYANYQTDYLEAGLQGLFYFSQLDFFNNKSNFDPFLFAGIGGMRYNTSVDAAGLDGSIYDFDNLNGLDMETKDRRLANLNTLMDRDYETQLDEEANFTPLYQVGAGINWKIKNNVSVALSHRLSFTGTDEIDSYQWDQNNVVDGQNDLQHYTSISIGYTFMKTKKERPEVAALFQLPDVPLVALNVPPLPTPNMPSIAKVERAIREYPEEEKVKQEEKVILTVEEKEVVKRAFDNLEFETSRARIRSSSFSALNELADLLLQHPSWKLKISGHTDSIGRSTDNMKLSQRRAQAVRDYLAQRGLSTSRFIVQWFGEEQPIANNKYKEGRQKNRRVEMEIVE